MAWEKEVCSSINVPADTSTPNEKVYVCKIQIFLTDDYG